jgi:hypothetical protein
MQELPMNTSAWSSRLVPALAVTAVAIAALGTVIASRLGGADETRQPPRPAADAPVRVVKAPDANVARSQRTVCTTCTLGASSGRSL